MVEKAAADVSCRNRSQKTALHYSAEYGHVEVTQYLLSKRIDVMAITTEKQTAYDLICMNCRGKDRETKSEKLRETLIQYVELAKEMHIAANSNFAVGTVEYDKAQKKLARINRLLSDHQTWLDSFIEEEVVQRRAVCLRRLDFKAGESDFNKVLRFGYLRSTGLKFD